MVSSVFSAFWSTCDPPIKTLNFIMGSHAEIVDGDEYGPMGEFKGANVSVRTAHFGRLPQREAILGVRILVSAFPIESG